LIDLLIFSQIFHAHMVNKHLSDLLIVLVWSTGGLPFKQKWEFLLNESKSHSWLTGNVRVFTAKTRRIESIEPPHILRYFNSYQISFGCHLVQLALSPTNNILPYDYNVIQSRAGSLQTGDWLLISQNCNSDTFWQCACLN